MVRVKLDRSRRGHSSPAVSACPTKAFMPVPEYWIELTLPIAACAACKTVAAVLGVLQPATPNIKPANSQSFLDMACSSKKILNRTSTSVKDSTLVQHVRAPHLEF